ncbi:MAG TPA: glucosidase [Gemmataceae bacterium]|nr:glucosidase [Gemmataceae bacterium]
MTAEHDRLERDRLGQESWRRWGPYVSDRQWGTVREDYSADSDAWVYLPFDHSRSRAYRWGEDGIAGISDEKQILCLALALWNGKDPILKERLFGLTNGQGNHGEDVKEDYYYLDATPTHSYLKMLYKYPQRPFPYAELIAENGRRNREQPEFELLDTGVFNDDRYFDVFVEYAKAGPDDILMRVTAWNRGPEPAELHLLPTVWFRNRWSWKVTEPKPTLRVDGPGRIAVEHADLGNYTLFVDGDAEILFCENETNTRRLYGSKDVGPFKDGINDYVVNNDNAACGLATGTKIAAHYRRSIAAGGSVTVRVRLAPAAKPQAAFADFDEIFARRIAEADEFYDHLQHGTPDPDARLIQRQAYAGMVWSKQFYHFDVPEWLDGDPGQPPPPEWRHHGRNSDWRHLWTRDIVSMPDKWEYPWFAAWDLAFHCIPLAHLDAEFAKQQLVLLTREWYMHPNGQLPAYEWNFGDVNPPVHAWAVWRVYQIDRKARGHGDVAFLERVFHKLLLNFTWWVNRKDAQGRNIFQGGFLGLDNIGVFDRSKPLPTGGFINQADGTAWMGMYSLNLMRIALELALHNPVYQDIATKFFEHFLGIAEAMTNIGGSGEHGASSGVGLWDEDDEFYYDELNLPNGRMVKLKVRSMVGLIPMFAVETLEPEMLAKLPEFTKRLEWFLENRPNLANLVSRWKEPGRGERRLLSLLRGHRLKSLLRRMLDESEFLSDYGVRALSRHHLHEPYVFTAGGQMQAVWYLPGESDTGLFGGNSNWRGPIWMPVNYLILESLQKFHHYYGDDFKVECPTGSGKMVTIEEVSEELTRRLTRLFLRDEHGRRPIFGESAKLQTDPHFRDYLVFPEYFHGDTGRGCGAMHQTGWTGLVAKLLRPRRRERQAPAGTFQPGAAEKS